MDLKEKIAKATHKAAVAAMQSSVNQVTSEGVSGTDLLELLSSDDLKPYLADLTFQSVASDDAEDEEEEIKDKAPPKKVSVAKKDDNGNRTYLSADSDERKSQREVIFQTVSKAEKATGKEISMALSKKFPDIKPWTVNALVSQMVDGKNLRRSRKKGTKAWFYGVGKKPA